MKKTFELCEEHIKLLQGMYWEYNDCETGGPSVDCKRPYGNSYVPPDVAQLLNVELPDEGNDEAYDQKVSEVMRFHYESMTALEIILQTRQFSPGTYENVSPKGYYKPQWKKVIKRLDEMPV